VSVYIHLIYCYHDHNPGGNWKKWSSYLRACPPSPKLLQDLEPILEDYQDEIEDEYHNVVQWLKVGYCFFFLGIFMHAIFLGISSTSKGINQPCGRVFGDIPFDVSFH
jgi:hypothetical protein